jgi:hypothetical protein
MLTDRYQVRDSDSNLPWLWEISIKFERFSVFQKLASFYWRLKERRCASTTLTLLS